MINVLLDETLPRKLKWALEAETLTVSERGWGGMQNSTLLAKAEAEFDVFITMESGIADQGNVEGLDLCIIVLSTVSNDIDDVLPLTPMLNPVLTNASPGRVIRISGGLAS